MTVLAVFAVVWAQQRIALKHRPGFALLADDREKLTRSRRRVQIVLTWSRDQTPTIDLLTHDAAPEHDACLIEVLESVDWPQPSPRTKVSIPLLFFTS